MHHPCGEHEVIRGVLLQHQPHPLHVVPGVTPVPHAVQVTQLETVQLIQVNLGDGPWGTNKIINVLEKSPRCLTWLFSW